MSDRRFVTWTPALVVVAVAAALGSLSCSSALPPSLEPVHQGLEATRAAAVAASRDPVDRFLALFRDFEAADLAAGAGAVYADDALFNDGFVMLSGITDITAYLERSAGHVDGLDVELIDVAFSGVEAYVVWQMTYAVDGGEPLVAPGISHLRFDGDGKIVYHRDYWDATGALVVHVPPVSGLMRMVRDRL